MGSAHEPPTRVSRGDWSYWPEIDGLRTIAVLSVAAFHFNRAILPGGFVGVDVFFVISGFLISSILLDDIAKQDFSIGRFYQRRISRIFPALLVVILATGAAGSFIYSAQDMASLGVSSAAAVASLINLKLITQGSYFVISADAQPLLHYWSLAVEEQFYLIFPLYLYAIRRFSRAPMAITLGLALASFALCIWLTQSHQQIAFYSLPTRAWELLIGASLSLYRSQGGRLGERAASGAAWGGLATILLSIIMLKESDAFPGWIAAFPVVGTAMLIAPVGHARPAPLRMLSHPTIVAIGKRSYSLYLWHWPVFSLIDYQFYLSGEPLRAFLKVALTLVLTEISYRYVEQPARLFFNVRSRRSALFVATAVSVATIVTGGIWLRFQLNYDVLPSEIAGGGHIVHGGNNGVVILSGDSQAAMYGAEVASIARTRGLTLYALGTAGRNQLPDEDETSWPAVLKLVTEKQPDLVILIDAWSDKLKNDPKALAKALMEIRQHTKQVLIVEEPPIAPLSLSRVTLRSGNLGPFFEPPESLAARRISNRILHQFESSNVHVVEVENALLHRSGSLRIVAANGRLTYFDTHHLSESGTALARPALEAGLVRAFHKTRTGPTAP